METNPQSTGQDEYEDQDMEPTMTAPDGARPDGKAAALGADASGEGGSGTNPTGIEDEMATGGGGGS
jgi:hypothetical protein